MRKYNKNQCKELIRTLEEAHGEIAKYISKHEVDAAASLLEQCQQAAIAIGDIVESSEGEGTDAVSRLEAYCEHTYNIHEDLISGAKVNPLKIEKKLKKIIRSAQNSINALPTQYEAVFLPYKASMWDSLESIWMAADEDENCDAYVIPIPYYDRRPDGSFSKIHYEGKDYPDYVPITNYAQFDLEEHHPDMIYIHNPYDGSNFVTSVYPDYYSDKLKQYTDCLVYVPYFATSGKMGEGQACCPAYDNADYIVVQNKDMIEQYAPHIPREKFLPLGSPKFDRVIRLCKNPPEPPAEWAEKMSGKRVYFYNTSIAGMLEDTGKFLQKMAYVFNTFQEVEDACILWRPHPLLESTFSSMRQEYMFVYEMLKDAYIVENVGIYDTTSDIEVSIAHSDAYIGDGGTSVISLFGVAGKPFFLLSNQFVESPPKGWWRGSYCYFPGLDERQNQYIVMPQNKLFYSPENNGHYRYFCDLPGGDEYNGFGHSLTVGNKTYLFPTNAQEILLIVDGKMTDSIRLHHKGSAVGAFHDAWILDDFVFLIPKRYPDLVRMEISSGKVDYIKDVSSFFWRRDEGESFCGGALNEMEDKIFFLDADARNMLEIGIHDLKKKVTRIDYGEAVAVCALQAPRESWYVWFLPREGKTVARWDNKDNTYQKYYLDIEGLISKNPFDEKGSNGNERFFSSIIPISEEEVIFCPNWANKFVLLDTRNGAVKEWIPPFPVYTEHINRYYYNGGRGVSLRSRFSNGTRWVNAPERLAYDLDVVNNRATPVVTEFSEKDIYEQYAKGFEVDQNGTYFLHESGWNPLKNIITQSIVGDGFYPDMAQKTASRLSVDTMGMVGESVFAKLIGDL